jgi:hypothetical protein
LRVFVAARQKFFGAPFSSRKKFFASLPGIKKWTRSGEKNMIGTSQFSNLAIWQFSKSAPKG